MGRNNCRPPCSLGADKGKGFLELSDRAEDSEFIPSPPAELALTGLGKPLSFLPKPQFALL